MNSGLINNLELTRAINKQRSAGAKSRKLKRSAGRFQPQLLRRRPLNPLELRFNALKEKWQAESAFLSSPAEMAMLDSYQKIIGLGPQVVPFLIRELSREPDFWFWALRAITGANPVPQEAQGNVDEMTKCWLSWYASRKRRGW